jgi:formate dehydrogenase
MGRCDTAPVLEIGHNHIDNATLEKTKQAISKQKFLPEMPLYEGLEAYKSSGGYSTLSSYISGSATTVEIEEKIVKSGLRGLGGAGFPAGKKWSFVRNAIGTKYLAVNGDEGEPGTFKDRFYLERTPHLFLEGMLIAAWAINADKVFIYMRDEYPAVLKILHREIALLENSGLVKSGYIDLRRGAGAYICGEESAMIESIEGKRGLPRHRPPYVAQSGIFNMPTLVHNIETLYWVTRICREGPEIFSNVVKNGRVGLRSYSVSGRVKTPGVHLLPSGSTIMDIISAAGGMLEGHIFMGYQPGGPSSGLLPAKINDVPLDFDTLQEFGTFIGSAAVVILSEQDSARDAALNMLRFFEDESCGQCTPCRVGCEKAVKLMTQKHWDKTLLSDLCQTMVDASICGLGQAAPNAILSTLKFFPDEV